MIEMVIKMIACVCVLSTVQSPFAELLGADTDSDARPHDTKFAEQRTETGSVARRPTVHVRDRRCSDCSEPVHTGGETNDSFFLINSHRINT